MESLIVRNNTSFPKEISELLKKLAPVKDDVLQYHQRIAHDYILKYPHVRGILGYQEMGSGKSILAASVCESIIREHPHMKVLIITSKSLHNNMRDAIRKYLHMTKSNLTEEETTQHIGNLYQFITLNAGNMLTQVYRANKPELDLDMEAESQDEDVTQQIGNLDNTFVVIDEAHNFFNSVVHGSKNAIGLYRLIMDAKGIKLLFLTGSPIINDPFEIAICYNLLAGTTLFGEDYQDFTKYFVSHPESLNLDVSTKIREGEKILPVMKNQEKFSNRILGLTSYYSRSSSNIGRFPTLLNLKVVYAPMTSKQYAMYAVARDRELDEAKRGAFRGKKAPLQKPGGSTSSYRVRSRQISNFLYPEYASEAYQDERGMFRYKKMLDALKPESFAINELQKWSTKFLKMLICLSQYVPKHLLKGFREKGEEKKSKEGKKVEEKKSKEGEGKGKKGEGKGEEGEGKGEEGKEGGKKDSTRKSSNQGPVLIYSQFLDSGILVFAKALDANGFREIKTMDDFLLRDSNSKGKYCIISGEVDPDVRSDLLRVGFSSANKYGEVMNILLFTSTGAEGMNTKYVRAVMAMEPYWHWARMDQVFARGVRLDSHEELPEHQRTVQPYLFLSDYPDFVYNNTHEEKDQNTELYNIEDTTDVTLYIKSMQNKLLNDSFLKVMQRSSFDCYLGQRNPSDCRMCKPTNRRLYIDDLDKDIEFASPCESLSEEKIVTRRVNLVDPNGNEREYRYTEKDGKLHIFEFDPKLNGYKEIYLDHPDYQDIITILSSGKKSKKARKEKN